MIKTISRSAIYLTYVKSFAMCKTKLILRKMQQCTTVNDLLTVYKHNQEKMTSTLWNNFCQAIFLKKRNQGGKINRQIMGVFVRELSKILDSEEIDEIALVKLIYFCDSHNIQVLSPQNYIKLVGNINKKAKEGRLTLLQLSLAFRLCKQSREKDILNRYFCKVLTETFNRRENINHLSMGWIIQSISQKQCIYGTDEKILQTILAWIHEEQLFLKWSKQTKCYFYLYLSRIPKKWQSLVLNSIIKSLSDVSSSDGKYNLMIVEASLNVGNYSMVESVLENIQQAYQSNPDSKQLAELYIQSLSKCQVAKYRPPQQSVEAFKTIMSRDWEFSVDLLNKLAEMIGPGCMLEDKQITEKLLKFRRFGIVEQAINFGIPYEMEHNFPLNSLFSNSIYRIYIIVFEQNSDYKRQIEKLIMENTGLSIWASAFQKSLLLSKSKVLTKMLDCIGTNLKSNIPYIEIFFKICVNKQAYDRICQFITKNLENLIPMTMKEHIHLKECCKYQLKLLNFAVKSGLRSCNAVLRTYVRIKIASQWRKNRQEIQEILVLAQNIQGPSVPLEMFMKDLRVFGYDSQTFDTVIMSRLNFVNSAKSLSFVCVLAELLLARGLMTQEIKDRLKEKYESILSTFNNSQLFENYLFIQNPKIDEIDHQTITILLQRPYKDFQENKDKILEFLSKCYNIDIYETILILMDQNNQGFLNKLFNMLDLNDQTLSSYALLKLGRKALKLQFKQSSFWSGYHQRIENDIIKETSEYTEELLKVLEEAGRDTTELKKYIENK